MHSRVLKSVSWALFSAGAALIPVALAAQATPAAKGTSSDQYASKWDIFAGYSYIAPKGTVDTPLEGPGGAPGTGILPVNFTSINGGAIGSVARYFNRYVGIELEGDVHLQNEAPVNGKFNPADDFSGGQGGLIFRFPTGEITPFVHALVGGEIIGGPHWQLST
ncbi:MAG: hypothetical protein ACRD19_17520, partial [Terriglobia bacterium]